MSLLTVSQTPSIEHTAEYQVSLKMHLAFLRTIDDACSRIGLSYEATQDILDYECARFQRVVERMQQRLEAVQRA